jgi:nucleoside-diphosphate-sugar epimerase
MKKNKKRILITGGMGFIGHNLAISLKKDNYPVKIIDSLQINNLISLKTSPEEYPNPKITKKFLMDRLKLIKQKKIIFDKIDARDYHKLCKSVDKFNPDVVIHLAAVSHADKSNKTPHTTFDHSLRTLENALDATKNKNVHFIYFSSSMVYGNFKKDIVTEKEVCNPIGIYGTLKLAGEMIVKSYNQVFGLKYTIVRPSALYGERCISRRVGQIFIENLIQGKEIMIKGSPSQRLDFTYIDDFVHGIKRIIQSKNSINQVFNITFGSSESINNMIKILKKNFSNVKINYKKQDKLVPKRGTLSTKKAEKLIGYKPKYNLFKGYGRYVSWYKKQNFFN